MLQYHYPRRTKVPGRGGNDLPLHTGHEPDSVILAIHEVLSQIAAYFRKTGQSVSPILSINSDGTS